MAFVKKNHPEYFAAHIVGQTDRKYKEFVIASKATIQGAFGKERDARKAMESDMADRKQRFEQDPKNGPVVVIDEFAFVE